MLLLRLQCLLYKYTVSLQAHCTLRVNKTGELQSTVVVFANGNYCAAFCDEVQLCLILLCLSVLPGVSEKHCGRKRGKAVVF